MREQGPIEVEVDRMIESWHAEPAYDTGRELHEYLGISWVQYQLYAEVFAMPVDHQIFTSGTVPMPFDMERVQRFAELARAAWPDDEVFVAINDKGQLFATGKRHVMLSHHDIERFERALKCLAEQP